MKHSLLHFFVLLLYASSLSAQHEWDQWRFGDSCAISFTGGVPVNVTGCRIKNYHEGTASISDPNGNLICYSDGTAVWDRTNEITPNGSGLKGHESARQAALILGLPGDTNLYYIFTSSAAEVMCDSGYRFNIFDRRLNGGLGDITSKNVLLYAPSSEQLTATHNAAQTGYWIVTHTQAGDTFVSYELTAAGISPPVYSRTGITFSRYTTGSGNVLSFSRNGSRMVMAWSTQFEMYDFDPATGHVSNALNSGPVSSVSLQYPYATLFSPDGTRLYVTEINTGSLWQYDAHAVSASALAASRYTVFTSGHQSSLASMQIAPDGKIYAIQFQTPYLATITSPDLPGAQCGFVDSAYYLGAGVCMAGLPNVVYSTYAPLILCHDTVVSVTVSICPGESYHFFGQSLTTAGFYAHTGSSRYGCDSTVNLILAVRRRYNIAATGSICGDQPYTFGGRQLSVPGTYRDTFQTAYGCDSIVTLTLTAHASTQAFFTLGTMVQAGLLHVTADTFWCYGSPQNFTLSGGAPSGGVYSGADVTGGLFHYSGSQAAGVSTVFYTYTDANGCSASDTTSVARAAFNVYGVVADSTSCFGEQYKDGRIHLQGFTIVNGPFLYSLDGGALQDIPDFYDLAAGPHTVNVKDAHGCDTSFIVIVGEPIPASVDILPGDTIIEVGSTLQVTTAFRPYGNGAITAYAWSPADGLSCIDCASPTATPYAALNTYTVTVTYNQGCLAITTVHINTGGDPPFFMPNAFSPNGDGENDILYVYGEGIKTQKLEIFNRWGEKVFESNNQSQGWDGTYKGVLLEPGLYVYTLDLIYLNQHRRVKEGSITLIR